VSYEKVVEHRKASGFEKQKGVTAYSHRREHHGDRR